MTAAPTDLAPGDLLGLSTTEFWRRPLADRMADLATIREMGPFVRATSPDVLTGGDDEYLAVTRCADAVEISRHPQDFSLGGIEHLPVRHGPTARVAVA